MVFGYSLKDWLNILSAVCAVAAALLWFQSARVAVWADGQKGPRSDNMVISKNGRLYDVSGTAQAQSKWSGYAAIAAGVAALLQAAVAVWMVGGAGP